MQFMEAFMSKIVLVGAGGVIFAQNFLKDILTDPELRTHEVTLMDIDAGGWPTRSPSPDSSRQSSASASPRTPRPTSAKR